MIIVAAGRGVFSIGLMLRNAQRPSAEPRLHGGFFTVSTVHQERLFRTWPDVAGAMIKATERKALHPGGRQGGTGVLTGVRVISIFCNLIEVFRQI